jgi:hypothetical protein
MSIATYGLQQIKKELQHLPQEQLAELALRLVRYKKGFMFSQLPAQAYFTAKGLRKILKMLTKYTKFIGTKTAEIELLLNFCQNYLQYVIRQTSHKPIRLIFTRQLEKVKTSIGKLHEDLQFDYSQDYNALLDAADNKLPWINKKSYVL